MRLLKSFLRAQNGQLAITMALMAVPVIGAVGAAVTYAGAVLEKNEMQQMLDAAVIAGTTLGYSAADKERLEAAYSVTGLANPSFGGEADVKIHIGAAEVKFETKGTSVSGTSTTRMPNPFSSFVGPSHLPISVSAKAEKRLSEPVCLLALNASDPESIQAYGNATLNANCTAMANSSSPEAIKQFGQKASIAARRLGTTGSFGGAKITPTPEIDIEPMADPYSALPVPKAGLCIDVGKLSKANFVLDPGTYCGGLTISPGATVELRPGIFVMKDGQLSIGANSVLGGQEVMIAFVGFNSTLNSNSGSVITLTSPTTGIYKNIQFMSDRTFGGKWKGEEWMTLSSTTLSYDGVMYLPEQDYWIKGGSQVIAKSPTFSMIGDQFWIQDTSDVVISQENSRNLTGDLGSAAFKYSARLAE